MTHAPRPADGLVADLVAGLPAGRHVAVAAVGLTGAGAGAAGAERIGVDESRVLPSASLIKLPVLVAVLHAVAAGELALDEPLPVLARHRVGGSGVLAGRDDTHEAPVADLLRLMVTISDNAATNVLVDRIGMATVNRRCDALALTGTRMRRLMMDAEAAAAGRDNVTTASDVTALLAALAGGACLPEPQTAFALDLLLDQRVNDRLPRWLPAGWRLAHKTGELPGVRHDAGVALRDGRPLLAVSVLTAGFTGDEQAAADLVAAIGRRLWRQVPPAVDRPDR